MKSPKKKVPRHSLAAALFLTLGTASSQATVLFTDNFNIANTPSLDGSDQTGRHTGLLANDIVLRSGGVQHTITGSQLDFLKAGANDGRVRFQNAGSLPTNVLFNFATSSAASQILADGGLRIEFDWITGNNTATDWVGFAIGNTTLDQAIKVANAGTDFGMIFRQNGGTQIFDNGAVVGTPTYDVTSLSHHAVIEPSFISFGDGTTVTVSPFVDGNAVGSPVVVQWDNNAGLISLELSSFNSANKLDNIVISTVPEPATYGFAALAGLATVLYRRRQARRPQA